MNDGSLDLGAIDVARIEHLRGLGGGSFLSEVVALFQGFACAQLAELERAVAAGDRGRASRCAHAIKSSAANVGARAVQDVARAMEIAAAADAMPALCAQARALRIELEAAAAVLDTLAAGPPAPDRAKP